MLSAYPKPIKIKSPLADCLISESVDQYNYDLFTEAVFANGHEKVKPIEEKFAVIKAELKEAITKDKTKFDPEKFWKSTSWKDLEDTIADIFGFRIVVIEPLKEKYVSSYKGKTRFQSAILNAYVYSTVRYPIEGLVTEKGFYDKSKSCQMDIIMTLGLIDALEPDEIVGILLHEFGHGVDPALVDITYLQTNVLTKYMTDRKKDLTNEEEKVTQLTVKDGLMIILYTICMLFPPLFIPVWIIKKAYNVWRSIPAFRKKYEAKAIEDIRKIIKKDQEEFNRQNYAEAYADNFARMYGYGPALMRAIKKMGKDNERYMKSRIKQEAKRKDAIIRMTKDLLNDSHKTDIHRIRALIKEYKADIEDPDIPKAVRDQEKADLKELELILNSYTKDFDNFQNRINRMINEELAAAEKKAGVKPDDKPTDDSDKKDKKDDKK